MKKKPQTKEKVVKAWAIVNLVDDGFIPDLDFGSLKGICHIHYYKKDAVNFLRKMKDKSWGVAKVTISFKIPKS